MDREKRRSPKQIADLLREIDAAVECGQSRSEACVKAGISEQTYLRWWKRYGELRADQIGRLKELEAENIQLRRLVTELSLAKLALKDIVSREI